MCRSLTFTRNDYHTRRKFSQRFQAPVNRFTELLSTRIFNFNRTTGELYFTTETQLREIAVACGMAVEIIPNDKYTSNTIYIFRKPN